MNVFSIVSSSPQKTIILFAETKVAPEAASAHTTLLSAMQSDLNDRRLIAADLATQRNPRILATYQNVWRLAPRLNTPELLVAKTAVATS